MNIPFHDLGLLVTALLGAALTSAVGVSSSVMVIVVGAMWVHPVKLVVLIALYSLTVNVVQFTDSWRSFDGRRFLWLVPGAVVGAWLGAQALVMLPPPLLRQIIAGFAILYVIVELLPERQAAKARPLWLPFLGIIYGASSGLSGLQGLTSTPLLTRLGVIRKRVIGTASLTAIFVGATKIATYQSLGLITERRWILGGLFVIAAWMGTATGKEVFDFAAGKVYGRVLLLAILALAVTLILRAEG